MSVIRIFAYTAVLQHNARNVRLQTHTGENALKTSAPVTVHSERVSEKSTSRYTVQSVTLKTL